MQKSSYGTVIYDSTNSEFLNCRVHKQKIVLVEIRITQNHIMWGLGVLNHFLLIHGENCSGKICISQGPDIL